MAFVRLSSQLEKQLWACIPVIRLEPPYTKVAISLPDLIRQTNAFSVKRRAGCTPTLATSKPKQLFLQYKVVCHESYSDPSGHDVQVQFDLSEVEKTQDAKKLDVRVNCSCPAFLYWGAQWNLHQRDGLHGQARPLLQAPTERLDLRSNFVICKHVKAVFERILPAIQHNIQNIVREKQVDLNKKRLDEAPPSDKGKKLKDRQEELRKKKEIEKIIKTQDPDKQKEMIDELVEEESKKLEGEPSALPPLDEPKKAPEAPPAPPKEKEKVVQRDEKAAEPPTAQPMAPPEHKHDLNDLIKEEERKLIRKNKAEEKVPKKPSPGMLKKLWNWLQNRFKKKKQTSLKTSGPLDKLWSEQEMADEAGVYENQAEDNVVASNYVWRQENNFPVTKIDGVEDGPQGWKQWWNEEMEMANEVERGPYYQDMEQWWSKTPDEHLIIVEGNGRFHIWEGTHRFALSMIHGHTTVPAFVGYKRSE